MRKTNTTRLSWMRMLVLSISLLGFSNIFAQSISCNPLVHISLDANCQGTVGADQILVGNYPNLQNFTVTFTNSGLPVILNSTHVGFTFNVTVTSPTGSSCSGNILVEDHTPPVLVCQDVILECTDPLPMGPTSATDACSQATVTFQDVVQDNGCSGAFAKVITRTYTATDASGNSANCTQIISIKRATLAGVSFPQNIQVDCQQSTDPTFTGEPTGTECFNLHYFHSDNIIDICPGSIKIHRTWTVTDMCGNQSSSQTQIIKKLDTTGPTIQPIADILASTSSNNCEANVQLPAIGLSDNCSGNNFTVEIQTPFGWVNGNGGLLQNVPLGTHSIIYFATDACGMESSYSLNLTITDQFAPQVSCVQTTTISLNSNGDALIPATVFDDGSSDNCGIVEYKARRMDNPNCPGNDATSFGDFVPFTCCDLAGNVMVELRVRDAAGNTNSCMVEVLVEDKIDPTITCPPHITISCEDDPEDLTLTGEATATDNCPGVIVTHNDINVDNDCGGAGTITRAWTATDAQGRTASCIQIITLVNDDPFYINNDNDFDPTDDIDWPLDYTTNTCGAGLEPSDLPAPYDRPVIHEDACDFIASNYTDTYLPIQEPACVKILRKWIVVDWCQAGQNADVSVEGPGVWHYVQLIKVLNSTDPVIDQCEIPAVVENFEADCGATFAEFQVEASDDCTLESDLEYFWEFSSGESGVGKTASGNFVNGNYSLTFTVEDGCGNITTCENDFEVKDAKKPTPVCILGLASVIMPTSGTVTIEVSSFESGDSYDNCTAYDDLIFSFSNDTNESTLEITCDDIAAGGFVPVEIWATDENGNQDFCTTLIQIQDNAGTCISPTALSISGEIKTVDQEGIKEVTVGISAGPIPSLDTQSDGYYIYSPLEPGGDYTITPEKDLNYLNGVTTYDLVLISKHILGIELLDSPYKWIAADANHSETITALDIVKLRALILHIEDELSNNTSWRFVDADFIFPNTSNPFATAFPEEVSYSNLQTSQIANFIGVKIGDVNGTALPNYLTDVDTRNFAGTLDFVLENKKLAVGEEVKVDFRAKDFEVNGYQFALEYNGLDFVDVKTKLEKLTINNFGFTLLEKNILTTSWNNAEVVKIPDDEILFTLTFLATKEMMLSEALSLSEKYTPAEAYNSENELLEIALNFGDEIQNTTPFTLYQNTPNPFKNETTIGFNLPKSSKVSLKIYDTAGRVLKLVEGDFSKGYHEIIFDNEALNGSGVLYYQLDTDENTATKKMLLVD